MINIHTLIKQADFDVKLITSIVCGEIPIKLPNEDYVYINTWIKIACCCGLSKIPSSLCNYANSVEQIDHFGGEKINSI